MKKTIAAFCVCVLGIVFFKVIKKDESKPFLTVVGFVKMADGLGRQCPDMIDALKDDFDIGFIPLAPNNLKDVKESILPIIQNPRLKQGAVVFLNDNPWRPAKKGKPYGALRVFDTPKQDDQIRICYTMVESTKIPNQWIDILNQYFDLVVVPDPFLVEVFESSGVTTPVVAVPLGLDLKPFLDQPIKTSFNKVFRFGTLGSLGDRKNQMKLVHAFHDAFQKNPNIELLIHARAVNHVYKDELVKTLKELDNPQIIYSDQPLDKQDYLDLFKTIDVLVNVSKGEGFSIQPREAMALGIPCILTKNTAQATIADQASVVSLETPIKAPCYYNNFKQIAGENFDFDTESLKDVLRKTYEAKEELLLSSQSNKNYAETFDYVHMKSVYKNLIKPERISLGDKNAVTKDGLITNSKELYEKYVKLTGAKE
jgi:glycosyltransferase involved in cell wall biosynthesis